MQLYGTVRGNLKALPTLMHCTMAYAKALTPKPCPITITTQMGMEPVIMALTIIRLMEEEKLIIHLQIAVDCQEEQ